MKGKILLLALLCATAFLGATAVASSYNIPMPSEISPFGSLDIVVSVDTVPPTPLMPIDNPGGG